MPAVPDFVVGLDVQLQELKSMLLRDGVQIVVLSAPGGCGKTTLAKLLCNDDGIKGISESIVQDFFLFCFFFFL